MREIYKLSKNYLPSKEKISTFLALHGVKRHLQVPKKKTKVVNYHLIKFIFSFQPTISIKERYQFEKKTSESGTPPAVTNSSLNWPYVKI